MKLPHANLNGDFVDLLRRQHRNILDKQKQLRDLAVTLPYEMAEFNASFKKAKKICEVEDVKNIWSFKDEDCPYQKLKELTTVHKGKEIPIFSESYLYDTLGKEDARTVLALLTAIYASAGKPADFNYMILPLIILVIFILILWAIHNQNRCINGGIEHNFEARYSEESEDSLTAYGHNMLNKKTYMGDVCVWCGQKIHNETNSVKEK